jgi:hypothetical protein
VRRKIFCKQIGLMGPPARKRGAGELRVFPLVGGETMSEDADRRPDNKEEEQDTLLAKVVYLAPLFALILQAIELLLKLPGVVG